MRKVLGKENFHHTTNNIKYHCISLTKQIKYLYDNNVKSLKKEIENDTLNQIEEKMGYSINILQRRNFLKNTNSTGTKII